MRNRFVSPGGLTKQQFGMLLEAADYPRLCQGIVDAVHSIDDVPWLLEQLKGLNQHESVDVRGVSVSCVGHLARLHRKLDPETLKTVLKRFESDPDMAGRIQDALDDIDTFLG